MTLLDERDEACEPVSVRAFDARAQLVVEPQAAPDLVPQGTLVAEARIRVDAQAERTLQPLCSGRKCRELRRERRLPALLRPGERVPQELLAGREVVVDERFRDAGLVGNARHAQTVRPLADDDATGCVQDPGDAPPWLHGCLRRLTHRLRGG